MPACFPRRNDAIVPWVDRPVGEALPLQRWVQLPDATWVFKTSDQKVACGFGRWTTDCGLPSCPWWGRGGLWIYTTEGSWSSASAPDHRYVSAVRWSYVCGSRGPQTAAVTDRHWLVLMLLHIRAMFHRLLLLDFNHTPTPQQEVI